MKKLIVAALAALSIAGCNPIDPVVKSESEYRLYKIVEIKRPKHFRVVVEDTKTGFKQQVSVSKHCNRWKEVELYSTTSLMTTWTTTKSGVTNKRIEGSSICPRS